MGIFSSIFGKKRKEGPYERALNGLWVSDNGRWSAEINGYKILLRRDGELLYSGEYYHDYESGDVNARVHLGLNGRRFSTGEGTAYRIRRFYSENGNIVLSVHNHDERRLVYSDQVNRIVFSKKEG